MIIRSDHRPTGGLFDELLVDNFAGGGGASVGIERALGRAVDVAINHDPEAVAMHRVNHPATQHLCQDVWHADPLKVTGGRPVGLAWFSPDCTHHSKARGRRPIRDEDRRSRDLAWVVLRWAGTVRPRVIALENVEEFRDWGPLTRRRGRQKHPKACPYRRGRTFRRWVRQLEGLGYDVDWRELRACDYGAPTIRKRLFLIARCDGEPIQWPEVTHGNVADSVARPVGADHGALRRVVCGRDDQPAEGAPRLQPYRTAAECIDWTIPCPSIFERRKPLAENTLRRIAAGIQRYVIDAAEPFIVGYHSPKSPNDHRVHSLREPLGTQTTENRFGVCVPYLVPRYGERDGQAPRARSIEDPHPTITPTSNGGQLVAAFMARHYGGMTARELDRPTPTNTVRGSQNQLVTAHLMTNTSGHGGASMREPVPTLTTGNHQYKVAALLAPYYGSGSGSTGRDLREPAPTLTTRDRLQLVTVHLNGEPWVITDIGMRMLQPPELYAAQGFPPSYVHSYGLDQDGRRVPLTKTAQVRMCGNSVCPPVVEALVRANVPAGEPAQTLEGVA